MVLQSRFIFRSLGAELYPSGIFRSSNRCVHVWVEHLGCSVFYLNLPHHVIFGLYIYIYYRLIEIFSSMLIIIIIITIHVEIVQTIYTICEILIYKFEIHIEQFTSGKCDRLMPIYISIITFFRFIYILYRNSK